MQASLAQLAYSSALSVQELPTFAESTPLVWLALAALACLLVPRRALALRQWASPADQFTPTLASTRQIASRKIPHAAIALSPIDDWRCSLGVTLAWTFGSRDRHQATHGPS